MVHKLMLAVTIAVLSTTAVSAQDGATIAATAQPEAAQAAPAPVAKKSLAEKMAIAASMFGAGMAAFKSLKQQATAPAAPSAPSQTATTQ